ncbi:putative MFS aflatoxin efflux pump [Cryphonectria parasitica EP155]|uniref:MFS aflatoxin efflux pump n=1 Tax=Cryphonectria parasitica (strain ATCC 38755 / EP155) TaxID=660469 RepID=A0A9P4Y6Z4_CRYP1|nr:putative MFS aflatoxin efflux pump [Cryphonectria parasitica EP155]KAF3768067.1 putative MFS aflatoxin efflux pump [Cryphonectria parasitica EP155]
MAAEEQKLSSPKIVLLLAATVMSVFLPSLDRTVISTAIPQITNEFDSLSDVGWYGSAYLLTFCACQLLYGKIYSFFPVKTTLLTSILIFETASALCGAAPSSTAFIVGRAIAGIGAAGITTGAMVSIVFIVPLEKRPIIQGLMGSVFGIATIIGPLVGGVFTSDVTWRWCFYLDLPIGAVATAVIIPFLHAADRDTMHLPLQTKLKQLDLPGTLFFVPGIVCLILALQWGGQTYAWSNGRIVALLTLSGVLLVAFAVVQAKLPATATLPPRILKQRTIISTAFSGVWLGAGNYIFVYFLPIWFQSIKGVSAQDSGIRLLALMLPVVVGSISGGFINGKIGYYNPLALLGSCIMTIGAGLLTTLHTDTSTGQWIGYQLLYGLGYGWSFQVPNLATQVVLPKKDIPTGLAFMVFSQLLGSTIFVSVGENVLSTQLLKRLSGVAGIDASLITTSGATGLLASVPASLREKVLVSYNEALRVVFLIGLVVCCLAVLGLAAMEWKSVKPKGGDAKPQGAARAEAGGEGGLKASEEGKVN